MPKRYILLTMYRIGGIFETCNFCNKLKTVFFFVHDNAITLHYSIFVRDYIFAEKVCISREVHKISPLEIFQLYGIEMLCQLDHTIYA